MAKQKIEKASRKERRGGKQHKGWNYDKVKGDSWNARSHDGQGNQVGEYNPEERLFGPSGTPDRPADASANATRAYVDSGRGVTPQGTTAATQRPSIQNWFHNETYGQQGITRSTNELDWNPTNKRNT